MNESKPEIANIKNDDKSEKIIKQFKLMPMDELYREIPDKKKEVNNIVVH